MTKEKLQGIFALNSLMAAVGLVLLLFSVPFGRARAENWLSGQGGADTSIYLIVIEGYINSFLVAGGILFGIGLYFLILAYYKLLSIDHIKNEGGGFKDKSIND